MKSIRLIQALTWADWLKYAILYNAASLLRNSANYSAIQLIGNVGH